MVPDREPLTIGELARWLQRHEADSTELHRELKRIVEKLDERTDTLATRSTVLFAVIAVLWSIFLVLAPFIRAFLGIQA